MIPPAALYLVMAGFAAAALYLWRGARGCGGTVLRYAAFFLCVYWVSMAVLAALSPPVAASTSTWG